MKAQAIRVKQYGGPEMLEMSEVDVGDPGPDEIRIKQHAIGLNFIDIYYRTGLYQSPLPHGLGFEAAGVVEAVGSNVKFLQEGDRVAYGQRPLGAYASARVMPAQLVVRLPAKISFEEGAAVMLKGLTVQDLFRQTYRLQGNETILFHAAAGGVGLIACQWAKALGVKLIGTVSSEDKAALAKKHGLDGQDARVTCSVAMDKDEVSFGFKAELKVTIPGADKAKVQALVEDAHRICPYSRATRNNVPVTLTVV